jgi:hypothetical protein
MLEQHLRIKNNCYRCLKRDRDQAQERRASGLNGNAEDDISTLRSFERIKDIDFIKKCLKQIENLESANARLKKSIRLQDVGKEDRYEAAKLSRGGDYFTMERQIQTLKLKNETLYLKLIKIKNDHPTWNIDIDPDQMDFDNPENEKKWKESLRVYKKRDLVRSASPKQRPMVSKKANLDKLSKT